MDVLVTLQEGYGSDKAFEAPSVARKLASLLSLCPLCPGVPRLALVYFLCLSLPELGGSPIQALNVPG